MAKNTVFWINLESNVGGGKTFLLNKLKNDREFNKTIEDNRGTLMVFEEPIQDWEKLLIHFYEKPSIYAMSLQSHVISTLYQRESRALEELKFMVKKNETMVGNFVFIIITERSLQATFSYFLPLLRKYDYINQEENLVLEKNAKIMEKLILLEENFAPETKIFYRTVYLKTSPQNAFDRIIKRGRMEENQIPLHYVTLLHNIMETHFSEGDKTHTILNGDNCKESVYFDIKACINSLYLKK